MCSPTRETHIPGDMCSSTRETHIPSDMCSPTRETHIPSDMWSPTRETHIPSDTYSPTRETHIPSDMCSPTRETHFHFLLVLEGEKKTLKQKREVHSTATKVGRLQRKFMHGKLFFHSINFRCKWLTLVISVTKKEVLFACVQTSPISFVLRVQQRK